MKPSFTIPGKSQSIGSLSEPEFLGHFRPYTYQSTNLYINQHNLNPNSPYVGLCKNGQQRKSQNFQQSGPMFWDRSNGPSRPQTNRNMEKHLNGSKTQVGRKSYLKEFEETPDPESMRSLTRVEPFSFSPRSLPTVGSCANLERSALSL